MVSLSNHEGGHRGQARRHRRRQLQRPPFRGWPVATRCPISTAFCQRSARAATSAVCVGDGFALS